MILSHAVAGYVGYEKTTRQPLVSEPNSIFTVAGIRLYP
jgi:hypothetical protein